MIVRTANQLGASYVFISGINTIWKSRELYFKLIERKFPKLISKYYELYKHRNQPAKKYQLELDHRTRELCKKYGIKYRIS